MKKIQKPKLTKKVVAKRFSPKTIRLIILIALFISLAGITAYSLRVFDTSTDTTTKPAKISPKSPTKNTSDPQQPAASSPAPAPKSNKIPSTPNKPDANAQKLAFCTDADNTASKALVITIQDSQKYVDTKIDELMTQMSDGTIDWYQFKQQRLALLNAANADLDSAYNNYVATVKSKGCEPTHIPPGHYT